jgi:5-methylcytosine-specific restriction endonuclease McrA
VSNQKFISVIREAVWIAHAKRCAYTHELLDLGSMQIDHIIPEKFVELPQEFAGLKGQAGARRSLRSARP